MTTLEKLKLQRAIQKAVKEQGHKYYEIQGCTISLTTMLGLGNAESGELKVGINGAEHIVTRNIWDSEMGLANQADILDRVALKIANIKLFGE